MRFSPSGEFDTESTASAWGWSTYLCGRIACRMVSTDGEGAPARRMCVVGAFALFGAEGRGGPHRGGGRAGRRRVRVELVRRLRIGELREAGELPPVAERDRREARGL